MPVAKKSCSSVQTSQPNPRAVCQYGLIISVAPAQAVPGFRFRFAVWFTINGLNKLAQVFERCQNIDRTAAFKFTELSWDN